MKVKELIEILTKLDGNKNIYTENYDSEYGLAITPISAVMLLENIGEGKDEIIANSNVKDRDCYIVKI